MPDFHCRARSYLSLRLGIYLMSNWSCNQNLPYRHTSTVTSLVLSAVMHIHACHSSMPAIHHPCHTPLYSILFHPIPITEFLFLLLSSTYI